MTKTGSNDPPQRRELPHKGTPWSELRDQMGEMSRGDIDWREGRAAVYVFHAGDDVSRVQKEAYALFQSENGLGPMAFPSLARMEREFVDMALGLLDAPPGASGNVTSGGTDSITMAIKACRNRARSEGRLEGDDRGRIVVPHTAHLAFDKACHLMDLEIVRVPVANDLRADCEAMAKAIDESTILIVGSAPCFPYGLIDDLEALSRIALERDVWLHVDACVGGYFAPFARRLGVALGRFDFSLPGVASMSADLHKYGYAAKGASTVLFRSAALASHMPFDFDCWPGGRMTTPTLAGTRPGGAIAAAWAVMNFLGEEGYLEKQRAVLEARRTIENGLAAAGCEIVGDSKLGLFAWRHEDVHAYGVWQGLHRRGWFSALVTQPPAIHLMLSPFHRTIAERYVEDAALVIDELRAKEARAPSKAPTRYA